MIRKITLMGNPVLRRPADPVADPGAPEIRQLVADMVETMHEAGGIGIAAPQVGEPLRVVMFYAPPEADEERLFDRQNIQNNPLTVLVNPEIELIGDEREDGWEGCLSVPGLRGLVPRATKLRYRGVTPDGERIDRIATGFHARVVQHECDHLDGVLYPQRMTDLGQLMFVSEMSPQLQLETVDD